MFILRLELFLVRWLTQKVPEVAVETANSVPLQPSTLQSLEGFLDFYLGWIHSLYITKALSIATGVAHTDLKHKYRCGSHLFSGKDCDPNVCTKLPILSRFRNHLGRQFPRGGHKIQCKKLERPAVMGRGEVVAE